MAGMAQMGDTSTAVHPMSSQLLIIDGHNDVLLQLQRSGFATAVSAFTEGRDGAIDLKKAKAGGFAGGFFAVYVPSARDFDAIFEAMNEASFDIPLPPAIEQADALPVALEQMAILFALEDAGVLRVCRDVAAMRQSMEEGVIAAILHMEGAEAIDRDLHALHVFHRAGLRSLGPVWSRPTIFGEGVPFRFPSDGDIGAGLTEDGIRLVRECNALGIMVDVSHLNEKGFRDIAKHSSAPVVATHSNAHALCASSRNLTDDQLAIIRETDGMVGVNFAVSFLREDGRKVLKTPLDEILRHLDHLMEHAGETRVGFGSDFDGALVPEALGDAAGLPNLRDAMKAHGYDDHTMKQLCHSNWLRVLGLTWHS